MSEAQTVALYRIARHNYDQSPNYVTASEVQRLAVALVAISDDYQGNLDEADDIMAEP